MTDNNFSGSDNTVAGTIGGTAYILLLQISSTEMMKTMLLATLGAMVSFCVSLFLKWVVRRMRK